jgi:hypothetical protein
MPLQNRVTPEGDIIATPARGLFMGNRGGRIHLADRTLGRRRWATKAWITCRLDFRGRQRQIMSPRSYTELFFLDEATALAAGHRPCAECRRADFIRFTTLWASSAGREGRAYVEEVDTALHAERLGPGRAKRLHQATFPDLPDGVFVTHGGRAWLVRGNALLEWTPGGYGEVLARPKRGPATLLTPPHIVAVLAAGYAPVLHGSAAGRARR